MSSVRLIVRSLVHHLRVNVAVALGVAVATAVLTGALLVGDSVRGSLRHLALDRLGSIDSVLLTQRFFRTELASETGAKVADCFDAVFPAVLLQGTIERPGAGLRRASDVTVVGAGESFWNQGNLRLQRLPKLNEVVLNAPLASELGAAVGDRVILRLPQPSDIPADSPLGRRTATSQSRGLTVIEIVPAESLGRFGLRPTQQNVFDAFTGIETVEDLLGQRGKANAIFAAQGKGFDAECQQRLERTLKPALADYGIQVAKTDRGYFDVTSDRMVIEQAAADAILREFQREGAQPVFVYLANYIKVSKNGQEAKIPYSTIAAVDFAPEPPLGPLGSTDGTEITRIPDDEIVLNSWVADDMRAQGVELQPGDEVTLEYFLPETTHGNVREGSETLKLAAIVPMDGLAGDPNLTPELQGVTDQESIANWDPPFPYDASRVRSVKPNDQDEQYWEKYKATPKGFVSLKTGQRLWQSRFGRITSIRIPARPDWTADMLAGRMAGEIDPRAMGFVLLPLKAQALEAAAGTQSFNDLFLGLSFFIIASAVMLVALLFKLGIDQRAAEIGVLLATGIRQSKTRWMLVAEGAVVASLGAVVGVAGGVGYAWLMIYGLNHWWREAVVTSFLELYITPLSLILGFAIGLLIAVATIAWSVRQLRRASIRRLLSGQSTEARFRRAKRAWAPLLALVMLVVAAATLAFAPRLSGEAQAGAFVGAGALVLGGLLATVWHTLRTERAGGTIVSGASTGALVRLAIRNGARSPLRSTLTIGLVATATFLIVAMSAFRLEPPDDTGDIHNGSGGFQLIAQSDQPIYQNLNSAEGRRDAGFDDAAEQAVHGTTVIPLRVRAGDDASCLNLYKPQQPRVVGVPPQLIERGGFEWAKVGQFQAVGGDVAKDGKQALSESPATVDNPWRLLDAVRTGEPLDGGYLHPKARIPVIIDANTATYSLKVGIGDVLDVEDGRGQKWALEVVALLKNSVFQGDLLISQANFETLYPDISGYRMFVVAKNENQSAVRTLQDTFEMALSDYGVDVERTRDRLAGFMAVQNTYLSTFQSLGGLGLLLGTVGLAVVQLRNVLERRGELALLRATGFRRRRLGEMVMLENAALLCFGLGTGIVAALVAILPQLLMGEASVPWLPLALTLLLVLAAGLLAGLFAVRATVRAPLLAALRGE
jgi:ABC-type lipoprotein release transport system permease subunit